MALTKDEKETILKKAQQSDKDTGSPEVQVSLFTERITQLTEHLKMHKKDYHSRRGLMQLIGKRQSLLKYLERRDLERYRKLIKELGLRK